MADRTRDSCSSPRSSPWPPIPDDIFFASITEINQKLEGKEFLRGRTDARVSAIVWKRSARDTTHSRSRCARKRSRAAKDVDDDIKRERFRGPLQGIPFGAKDLLSVCQASHHLGREALRRPGLRLHRHGAEEDRQARRHSDRQARHGGTRRRPQLSLRQRFADRPGFESLGPHALVGRIVQRLGNRGGRGPGDVRARIGNVGLHPDAQRVLRRHRTAAHLRTGRAATAPCRSPGRSTRSDRSAVRRKIAAWCCRPSRAATHDDPVSAGKSFYYAPQYAPRLKDIRVGFAPVDFNEWADPAARPDFAKALETIRSTRRAGRRNQAARVSLWRRSSAPSSPRKAPPFSSRSFKAARWISWPTRSRSPD